MTAKIKKRRQKKPEPVSARLRPPAAPTEALPGSRDKIAVLAERAAQRKEMHVPGDFVSDPKRALHWRRAGNTFVVDGVREVEKPDGNQVGFFLQEESFGDRLARLMAKAALGRKQLARELGVYPHVVGRWRNGECFPSFHALVKLADVLGVSLDELCGRRAAT